MTPREERGLVIAATSRLHRNNDGTWRVPSQTSKEAIFYTVNLETKACTCPDCTEGGFVCKHYHAASIVYKREVLPDGTMPRYRELKTNRALYMTRPPGVSGNSNAPGYYEFTYEDKNLPSHYGWKQPQHLDELAQQYDALKKGARPSPKVTQRVTPGGKLFTVWRDDPEAKRTVAQLEPEVRQILKDLDAQGRWVTDHDGKARLVGQPKFDKGFR